MSKDEKILGEDIQKKALAEDELIGVSGGIDGQVFDVDELLSSFKDKSPKPPRMGPTCGNMTEMP